MFTVQDRYTLTILDLLQIAQDLSVAILGLFVSVRRDCSAAHGV